MTNDIDFLLLYLSHISQNSDLPFRTWKNRIYKFKPQNKIETLIQKARFDTDKLFMQRLRDEPENTKLSIIIKYILNSNEQLYLGLVHTKLAARPDTNIAELILSR